MLAPPLWALFTTRNVLAIRRPQGGTMRCGLQIPNSLSLDHLDEAFGTEAVGVQAPAGRACICFKCPLDSVVPSEQSPRIVQQATIVAPSAKPRIVRNPGSEAISRRASVMERHGT